MSKLRSANGTSNQNADEQSAIVEKLALKVSELTIVVHRLFKTKHECELEIEYLKEEFGNHIREVEDVYKNKISSLERQLTTTDNLVYNEKHLSDMNSKLNNNLQTLQRKHQDVISLMGLKDESLDQYRAENQTLIHTIASLKELMNQNDKQDLLGEMEVLKKEMADKDEIIMRCQEKNDAQDQEKIKMEENYNMKEKSSMLKLDNLKVSIRKLEGNVEENKKLLEESDNARGKVLADKKSKELEIQRLMKQLQDVKQALLKRHSKDKAMPESMLVRLRDEEIYYLHRELQKYRLELLNREKNYNHMFSSNQPVIVQWSRPLMAFDLTGQKQRGTSPQLPSLPTTPRVSTNGKKHRLLQE